MPEALRTGFGMFLAVGAGYTAATIIAVLGADPEWQASAAALTFAVAVVYLE